MFGSSNTPSLLPPLHTKITQAVAQSNLQQLNTIIQNPDDNSGNLPTTIIRYILRAGNIELAEQFQNQHHLRVTAPELLIDAAHGGFKTFIYLWHHNELNYKPWTIPYISPQMPEKLQTGFAQFTPKQVYQNQMSELYHKYLSALIASLSDIILKFNNTECAAYIINSVPDIIPRLHNIIYIICGTLHENRTLFHRPDDDPQNSRLIHLRDWLIEFVNSWAHEHTEFNLTSFAQWSDLQTCYTPLEPPYGSEYLNAKQHFEHTHSRSLTKTTTTAAHTTNPSPQTAPQTSPQHTAKPQTILKNTLTSKKLKTQPANKI